MKYVILSLVLVVSLAGVAKAEDYATKVQETFQECGEKAPKDFYGNPDPKAIQACMAEEGITTKYKAKAAPPATPAAAVPVSGRIQQIQ